MATDGKSKKRDRSYGPEWDFLKEYFSSTDSSPEKPSKSTYEKDKSQIDQIAKAPRASEGIKTVQTSGTKGTNRVSGESEHAEHDEKGASLVCREVTHDSSPDDVEHKNVSGRIKEGNDFSSVNGRSSKDVSRTRQALESSKEKEKEEERDEDLDEDEHNDEHEKDEDLDEDEDDEDEDDEDVDLDEDGEEDENEDSGEHISLSSREDKTHRTSDKSRQHSLKKISRRSHENYSSDNILEMTSEMSVPRKKRGTQSKDIVEDLKYEGDRYESRHRVHKMAKNSSSNRWTSLERTENIAKGNDRSQRKRNRAEKENENRSIEMPIEGENARIPSKKGEEVLWKKRRASCERSKNRPKVKDTYKSKCRRIAYNGEKGSSSEEEESFQDDGSPGSPSASDDSDGSQSRLHSGEESADSGKGKDRTPKEPMNAIEQAVQACKAMRNPRKKDLSKEKIEKECIIFLERMIDARDGDMRSYTRGEPALRKLRMLRQVELINMKKGYRESLIENGMLPVFKTWLEPLSGGALPNIQTRITLLKILSGLPVTEDWVEKLRGSYGLGKVVNFLAHNEDYEPNRRLAEKIVERWARAVYQKNGNFNDLLDEFDRSGKGESARPGGIVASRRATREMNKDFKTQREKIEEFRKDDEERERTFAEVPRPARFLYTTVPEGKAEPDEKAVMEHRAERATSRKVNRTLSTLRRKHRNRAPRAARPSVNGR